MRGCSGYAPSGGWSCGPGDGCSHHASGSENLLGRNALLVWFTDVASPLPQHVTFRLRGPARVHRVGIYLHGENLQNPQDLEIAVSGNGDQFLTVVRARLEHRAGDHLFDLSPLPTRVRYVRFTALSNFGGVRYLYVSLLCLW